MNFSLELLHFEELIKRYIKENGLQFVVGEKVGGCDLVLSCGQLQAEDSVPL